MQDGKLSGGNYYNHSLNFKNNTVLLNNVNVNGQKATCPEKSKLSQQNEHCKLMLVINDPVESFGNY